MDKENFFETEAFSKTKLQLSHDKVEAKKTSICGWLQGGIPETVNLINLKLACEAHLLLKEFQIEARTQVIKLFSGTQDTPANLQVKSIHIIGDDRLTVKPRKAFNNAFGSRNDSGYPRNNTTQHNTTTCYEIRTKHRRQSISSFTNKNPGCCQNGRKTEKDHQRFQVQLHRYNLRSALPSTRTIVYTLPDPNVNEIHQRP